MENEINAIKKLIEKNALHRIADKLEELFVQRAHNPARLDQLMNKMYCVQAAVTWKNPKFGFEIARSMLKASYGDPENTVTAIKIIDLVLVPAIIEWEQKERKRKKQESKKRKCRAQEPEEQETTFQCALYRIMRESCQQGISDLAKRNGNANPDVYAFLADREKALLVSWKKLAPRKPGSTDFGRQFFAELPNNNVIAILG